jgi:large subunit ribosomal protein L21
MADWVWLILIIVIILIVWWAMSRSTKEEPDIEAHVEDEVIEDELEEVMEAAPSEPDDLAALEGIGPKVQSLLYEAGINTFTQLAEADTAKLNEILDANGLQMLDPATWPEQAKLASEGKMEELQKLQDELKGGRKV